MLASYANPQRKGLTHVSVLVEMLLARYGIDMHEFDECTAADFSRRNGATQPDDIAKSRTYAPCAVADSPLRVAEPLQQTFGWYASAEMSA